MGGDVIQTALASPLTPAAFSFGWVSYAVTALLTSVGQTAQPPSPKIPVLVFNLKEGTIRMNDSWLLARLFKTYERWMPLEVRHAMGDPESSGKDVRVRDQEWEMSVTQKRS